MKSKLIEILEAQEQLYKDAVHNNLNVELYDYLYGKTIAAKELLAIVRIVTEVP